MVFWLTEKAVPPLPMVYGGEPPKIVTSPRTPLAQLRLFGPVKVNVSGTRKNPGLLPVACAMLKVARRKALVRRGQRLCGPGCGIAFV